MGRESEALVRRAGADDLHLAFGQRPDAAILHLVIFALEVGDAGLPQLAQDVGIFAEHLVAVAEMLVARPQPHLAVFGPLPAGDQVEPEAAVADRIDRVAHPRAEGGRDDQGRAGRVDLDLLGDRGEPGHQGEALQIIFPELGLAAEAPQLDHREQEIDAVFLGPERDLLVEIEARHVLRRVLQISQPLLPIGMKMPTSMHHAPRWSCAGEPGAGRCRLNSSGSVTLQAWPPQCSICESRIGQPVGKRRAGSARARACRPPRRATSTGVGISPSRSAISKACERRDPLLDRLGAREMRRADARPRASSRSRCSRDPVRRIQEDRLGAQIGFEPAVAQQRQPRSKQRRICGSSDAQPLTTTSRPSRSGARERERQPDQPAGRMADQVRALDARARRSVRARRRPCPRRSGRRAARGRCGRCRDGRRG